MKNSVIFKNKFLYAITSVAFICLSFSQIVNLNRPNHNPSSTYCNNKRNGQTSFDSINNNKQIQKNGRKPRKRVLRRQKRRIIKRGGPWPPC